MSNKTLFTVAAVWNLVAGIVGLTLPSLFYKLAYRLDAVDDTLLAVHRGLWFCVFVFGIGYALAARDLAPNRGVVVLGILGKTGLGLYWILQIASGLATPVLLGGALGDLVFAALFFRALKAS